jgi:uncharacterized protein (TIGR03083 family)
VGTPPVVSALAGQHADLAALLDDLDDPAWSMPTRCDGWTVADVVLHLAQVDELVVEIAVTGAEPARLTVLAHGTDGVGTVDDGADELVAQERGAPVADLRDRWRDGAAALRAAARRARPAPPGALGRRHHVAAVARDHAPGRVLGAR